MNFETYQTYQNDSIYYSIWDSINDSINDSIWNSINDSINDSIDYSIWDSILDSIWEYQYKEIERLRRTQ